jgi:hypothetical protein
MVHLDPWEKAADCERALRLILDPVHREHLTNIREFWICLASKRRYLSEQAFAREAEAIGRHHANLISCGSPAQKLIASSMTNAIPKTNTASAIGS